MNTIKKHRRQAAWLCFEPHLPETQRIQAIQILESGYQTDSISNLIAYVNKVCTECGIEGQFRKSLYTRLHQLMTEDLPLSIDPLTFILEIQPPVEQRPKLAEPELRQPIAKPVIEEPKLASIDPTVEKSPLPDRIVIFVCFVKHVLDNFPETTAFFTIIEDELKDTKQVPKELAELMSHWLKQVDDFAWAESLEENILAHAVHLIYMGLCETLGPIGADEVFHKAIASCEQLPEARRFSPARFL